MHVNMWPAKKRVTFDETPHYAKSPETQQREQTREHQLCDSTPRDQEAVWKKDYHVNLNSGHKVMFICVHMLLHVCMYIRYESQGFLQ